jgi:hypothetical protein
VGFQATALTLKQIAGAVDLAPTARTDRTRSGFVDFLEVDPGNGKGVFEPVDQLAVGPEVVGLLVDPRAPVRREHVREIADVHGSDVLC